MKTIPTLFGPTRRDESMAYALYTKDYVARHMRPLPAAQHADYATALRAANVPDPWRRAACVTPYGQPVLLKAVPAGGDEPEATVAGAVLPDVHAPPQRWVARCHGRHDTAPDQRCAAPSYYAYSLGKAMAMLAQHCHQSGDAPPD